jgi:hypothetical protein
MDTACYDGPLARIFQYVERGTVRFFYHHWWDCSDDRKSNAWLIVPVSTVQLLKYVSDTITICDLIRNPEGGTVNIMRIDEEGRMDVTSPMHPSELDQSLMPDDDCLCGLKRNVED